VVSPAFKKAFPSFRQTPDPSYYQMPDDEWETVKAEYEQTGIANFFNLQDHSIGDETDLFITQTRWFRDHGGNLCHTVTETRRSDKEFISAQE
jgi:hypothetical protein